MSLVFGRLTQDFVDFNVALNDFSNPLNTLGTSAKRDRLAQQFRDSAALNSTYMVYLGKLDTRQENG